MVRETDPVNRPEQQPEGSAPGAGRMREVRSAEQARQQVEQTRSRMSDTLNTLEEKLAPRRLYDQVVDFFKPAEGESSILEMLRRNPVPVVLVAAGATWLAIDMVMSEQTDEWVRRPSAGKPVSGSTVESGRQRIGEASRAAGEKVSDITGSVRDRASQAASDISEKASSAMESAKSRVGEAADTVRGKAQSWIGSAKERLAASDKISRPGSAFQDMFADHPFAMAAGAVAAGIIAGLVLPPTRREEELFGETGERLVGGVRESGRRIIEETTGKVTEKMSTVAQAAADAATEKFHEQRKEGESIVDKAKGIVTQAKDSAVETMQKEGVTPGGIVEGIEQEAERAAHEKGLIFEEKKDEKDESKAAKDKMPEGKREEGKPEAGKQEQAKKKEEPAKAEGFNKSPEGKKKP